MEISDITMKEICLLIVFLSIFGCDNSKTNTKIKINHPEKGKNYEEIVHHELKTGKKNNKIFLGFSLGMTIEDFYEKLNHLVDSNIVYVDKKTNCMTYNLTTVNKKFKCLFESAYYENKLYQLTVFAKSDTFLPQQLITQELQLTYLRKYGNPDIEEPLLTKYDEKKTTWINGNRKIEIFSRPGEGIIIYEDLSVSNLIKKNEKDLKKTIVLPQ